MNNIGPSILPIAPAATNPKPSCAPEKELSGDGGSFDSLLQQSREEPAHDARVVEPVESADTPTPPIAEEPPDAAVEAGINAMFGLPALVPLPLPVLPIPTDATVANSVGEDGAGEPVAVTPEIVSDLPAPAVGTKPLTAFPTAMRQAPAVAFSAAAPVEALPPAEPESDAPPKDAKPLPRENAAPSLEVATVLGIIPPVQQAPVATVESTAGKTPLPNTQPSPPAISASLPTDRISAPLQSPRSADISRRNFEPITATAPAVPTAGAPTVREPEPVASVAPAMFAEPAPATPAIPAARNESPLPVQIAASTAKQVESLSPPAANVISEVINVVFQPEKNTGMMAAKPGSVMSSPTLPRSTRSTPATPAEVGPGEIAPVAAPMDGMQTLRTAPVLTAQNGREHSADDRTENTESPKAPVPEIASPTFSGELANTLPRTDGLATVKAADVAQVVTHTLQATERLIASGQERVELAVKLDNGSELTIQLRVANGQVTPIIRTESEPLRLALEQNWSRFSQRGGENELRITTPVFESPQTSSNMSDPHQQREGRQRAYNEPATEFYQNPTSRRNGPLTPPRTASPLPSPAAGVRLYA